MVFMIYQLIAKLQNLPAFNLVERDTLLSIIEHLNVRIEQLEDRVLELDKKVNG